MKDEVLKARTYKVERLGDTGRETITVNAHFAVMTVLGPDIMAVQLFEVMHGQLCLNCMYLNVISLRDFPLESAE